MTERLRSLLPGMSLAVPLPFLLYALYGALPAFLWHQPGEYLPRMAWIVLLGISCALLAHVIASLPRAREFVGADGQLDVRRALRPAEARETVLVTTLVMTWLALFMADATGLAAVYRDSNPQWHDAVLWQLEAPLFEWLQALAPGAGTVHALDVLYGLMWPFLFSVFGMLVVYRRYPRAMLMALTVLLMFHARLMIAIAWPTAGPAVAYPDHFPYLDGSTPHLVQNLLSSWHDGAIAQNGLYHGLVAMPSLHIGLTALAAMHLASLWRATLWLTVPWIVLTWIVTVLLGWHYVVDGFGGLLVAVVCHGIAAGGLRLFTKASH